MEEVKNLIQMFSAVSNVLSHSTVWQKDGEFSAMAVMFKAYSSNISYEFNDQKTSQILANTKLRDQDFDALKTAVGILENMDRLILNFYHFDPDFVETYASARKLAQSH